MSQVDRKQPYVLFKKAQKATALGLLLLLCISKTIGAKLRECCMCLRPISSRGQRRNIIAVLKTWWFLQCCNLWQLPSWQKTNDCNLKRQEGEVKWKTEKHCFDISRCIGQNSYLTIHPADAYGLKYGYEQQTHPAGSIRIKQLEDVHPSLTRQDKCQFPVKAPTCQTQLNKIKYKVNDECMIMARPQ